MTPREIVRFESHYELICREIEKRRRNWTIASVDFDDVKQEILIHVNQKLEEEKFDSRRGEFTHWLNGLISSQISNQRRKHLGKFSRPCIATPENPRGCPFNSGGEMCSRTTSGKQCNECPVYAKWEKRKMSHFAIKQTLPMEHHVQETHNVREDFIDILKCEAVLQKAVQEKLTKQEKKMYRLLYIQGKAPEEVGKLMGFKRIGHMYYGYGQIRKLRMKVVALALQTIAREGLV